ncbi:MULTISPECIES: DUF1254 domain-containing protein [unclassified Achromobacter]|uniref:DUF1254 domain-containing protein n=1 Tax=unclassified Achromobacter TaxID=2626865 RepID=UPI000B51C69A|nr:MULTISPECIES: DUF1254 domain-containing protein [unclassified Achromobacter]OWT74988.1 hypothetical protein CEY04_20710 [Achromobacter sp. HZ28]OWT76596.1 hypothetical protein CEY05_16165 [Achromobacter sp. HZ34]
MIWRRISRRLACFFLAGGLAGGSLAQAPADVSPQEARSIAADGYLYAYPLMVMEIARRIQTNVVDPDMRLGTGAPLNRFTHMARLPDPLLHDIGPTPDIDVLWSSMWFDVAREPLVIDVPNAKGRYFMMTVADMWSDVFAAPGTRTTGAGEGVRCYAIVAPDWRGKLPRGVELLRAPTSSGWLQVRIALDGAGDLAAAQAFQAGLNAMPFSNWRKKGATPQPGKYDVALLRRPPDEQVAGMSPEDYFATFAELAGRYAPHDNDTPILQRLRRIGIEPGSRFEFKRLPAVLQTAIEQGVQAGQAQVRSPPEPRAGNVGLIMPLKRRGSYGTDYALRARSMRPGYSPAPWVAPLSDDMVQVRADTDTDGRLLDGTFRYEIRFERKQLPPVQSSWSITLYNDRDELLDNLGNRHAVRMRDKINVEEDGTATIYLQYEQPLAERTRNWLPAPQSGHFSLVMRLYWPQDAAVEGTWKPPQIRRLR